MPIRQQRMGVCHNQRENGQPPENGLVGDHIRGVEALAYEMRSTTTSSLGDVVGRVNRDRIRRLDQFNCDHRYALRIMACSGLQYGSSIEFLYRSVIVSLRNSASARIPLGRLGYSGSKAVPPGIARASAFQ